jgi:hypothetical protein
MGLQVCPSTDVLLITELGETFQIAAIAGDRVR